MAMIRAALLFSIFSSILLPTKGVAEANLLFVNACVIDLDTGAARLFVDQSALRLTTLIHGAVASGILTPERVRAHYLGGIQGRKSREFVTYLTRTLANDAFVAAVADGRRSLNDAEAAFERDLNDLRKSTLAFGEADPVRHAEVTDRWRSAVKALSLELIGR